MKKLLTYSVSLIFLFSASVQAASDTDVTIIKVEKVVIEENVITIIGQARTTILSLMTDDLEAGGDDSTLMRRQVSVVKIISDRATFIIKRPELSFNDPDGTHAEEKEKSKKILDDGWKMSLAAAKELQAGREVGRIGFYEPDISIKGNLIDSITGFGYLYPKGK
jgi:hypothetical protein